MDDRILSSPEVDRERLANYLFWSGFWTHLTLGAATCGAWLPVWLAWVVGLGPWWSRRSAEARQYHLTPERLVLESGIYVLTHNSIPLEKVTDLKLSQGIIERRFGLWRMAVQTAGAGNAQMPEGLLMGLADPQGFRKVVLEVRGRLMGESGFRADGEHALRPAAAPSPDQDRPDAARGDAGPLDAARLERIERLLELIEENTRPRA